MASMVARTVAQRLTLPRAIAEQVFLLLEGVWATRRTFGMDATLDNAALAVQRLSAGAGG